MIRAFLLALLLCAPAAAQEAAPRIEITRDPEGPVTVGAPLTLRLTLLVPTYFPSPPVWPDLQIADAITRLPANSSRSTSARVAGATWSGITRIYQLIAQRPADYTLPASTITLTYADPASNAPVTAEVAVPEIAFTATVPPGAESLDPFMAAAALTLEATTQGLGDAPKPGDALTLTLTTTATGTPAMLLPPLLGTDTPTGLRAYPKQPVLTDTPGERGALDTARRVEAVTYVIEQPGDFTLPGISLRWWNTARAGIETASTDPLAFSVATPPGWTPARATHAPRWFWLAPPLLLAALLGLGWPRLSRRWQAARARRARSEPARYHALRRAIRRGPAGQIRAHLGEWQASAGATGPLPAPVEQAILARERAVYAPAPTPPGSDALLADLARYRRATRGAKLRKHSPLAPLNPAFGPARPAEFRAANQ